MEQTMTDDRNRPPTKTRDSLTDSCAKKMMKEAFEEAEGKDLYAYGKAVEKRFHTPVREAERAAQQAERSEKTRSGPQR
jgi:hypothetical protein